MERDRVVVIDDDPDFRELVALCVTDLGLCCLEAGSGPAALPILERERGRVRAVLLDYFLPGLSPRACARAVLDRVEPDVPVVLVSAAVDIAERAAELGLGRYLAKPFDIAALGEAVGRGPPGSTDETGSP
jgi:CheY-like chemotaxis protein